MGATLLASASACAPPQQTALPPQPPLGGEWHVRVGDLAFRDLDGSGDLAPYEDWRLTSAERARDLLGRMTLQEKAGTLMHGTAPTAVEDGITGYDLPRARTLIAGRHVTSLITRLALEPELLAAQNNALQQIAAATRLGIPVTVSTDPRHHFQYTAGASVAPTGFSQWPEMLGMAAIGDVALVRHFGDVARQEYRAVGIHMGLSPQADLATEPRWPRIIATFGEDAQLAGHLAQAYVEGFQGGADGVGSNGVAMVIKHFAGYGAARDGWDAHNYYGRFAHFPGGHFEYHVAPFRPAFASKVAGVMPTYSILQDLVVDGQRIDQVGGGFNRWLLTDVLRQQEGFDGMVLSDWAITNDCDQRCRDGVPAGEQPSFAGISTAWGVESLSKAARFARGLQAGLDQFGGTDDTSALLEAVQQGLLTEERIDESVLRVLRIKFDLGLFENPFVSAEEAPARVGTPALRAEGEAAQRRSLVLLENRDDQLPLADPGRERVFLHGISPDAAAAAGLTVTRRMRDATVVIARSATPWQQLHPGFPFGAIQHEGDLDFKEDDPLLALLHEASEQEVPVILTVFLDRPAVLTNIVPRVDVLLGDFGISDQALLDVILGHARAQGRLPFELPASMEAVRAQHPDVPYDSRGPLYPFGYGMAAAEEATGAR